MCFVSPMLQLNWDAGGKQPELRDPPEPGGTRGRRPWLEQWGSAGIQEAVAGAVGLGPEPGEEAASECWAGGTGVIPLPGARAGLGIPALRGHPGSLRLENRFHWSLLGWAAATACRASQPLPRELRMQPSPGIRRLIRDQLMTGCSWETTLPCRVFTRHPCPAKVSLAPGCDTALRDPVQPQQAAQPAHRLPAASSESGREGEKLLPGLEAQGGTEPRAGSPESKGWAGTAGINLSPIVMHLPQHQSNI